MSLFNSVKPPSPEAGLATGRKVAEEQQGYNIAAQRGSMVGQENPYGSLNYEQVGTGPNGVPIYKAKVSMSPENQALYNSLMGTKATAGTQAGNLLSGANYGAMSPTDVIGNMSSGMTSDIIRKGTEYLNPFFNTEREQLHTKLSNMGLKAGTPAYDNAMRSLDTSHGLVVSKQIADTMPQAFQMASQLYGMPAAMAMQLGGFGAPVTPNAEFVNAPQLQPPNLEGATAVANQNLMNIWKAQNEQQQNMMSGLMGIPTAILGGWSNSPTGSAALSSMLGLSDRRFKREIQPIGKWYNGLTLYLFKYLNDDEYQTGLMADEVEAVNPEAVVAVNGVKYVNYSLALS